MSALEQLRAAFEAWANRQPERYIGLALNPYRFNDGARWYKYERTEHMWQGFQGGRHEPQ